jgi:Sugar-transfer associated ATP-grasp
MTDATANDAPKGKATLETAKPRQTNVLTDMMSRLARESGRSLGSVISDHIKTAFGPGKLSFDEFVALRLFDGTRYRGQDLRTFVGLRRSRSIWLRANFQIALYDLIRNKISLTAMLEARSFPVIPIVALFTTTAGFTSERCLRSPEALRAFLTNGAHYPLFGKPESGFQSLGSASFVRYDAATDSLIRHDGRAVSLDAYIGDVVGQYGAGYLYQRRVLPHAANRALCGERLSTVRVMTLFEENGPRIWRACEKIPAGANAADNYWRPGNILVELDQELGLRRSATSGFGLDMCNVTTHPDSGLAIPGSAVPNWRDVCALALEGARLFGEMGMIGWDIAPVDGGAVIVEANVTPDLFLPQLADRRGILDEGMRKYLERRDRMGREWKREIRTEQLASCKASFVH